MVNNVVHATYTETYDLNTSLGEISLLGIHTPQAKALKAMFKGFFENYKKYKVVGCNLGMVCASQQSLTPSEIGLEAGSVDPRDVLNPILFKACTGENLNEILNQIYGNNIVADTSSVSQSIDSHVRSSNMYYQLLSDDTWRKEHPQRGLFVKGLTPLVHKIVTTQPFKWTGANGYYPEIIKGSATNPAVSNTAYGFGAPTADPLDTADAPVTDSNPTVFLSDGTVDMPWLDTTYSGTVTAGDNQVKSQNLIVTVPRVFCGCIVLPPAILQRLFFRMQISWHIMFKDFRPAFEVGPVAGSVSLDQLGGALVESTFSDGQLLGTTTGAIPTYWNIYHDSSTKLEKEFSSFDVNGEAEVQQVMESGS